MVDMDLEKFFDRVNHDMLMGRLAKRIADHRVLRLIRRYLNAGVLANGVVIERHEGTPQGGPLSPLLANVLLDEVDKELERRGHAFVRYADDCNVYVRSQRAGERVMASLRKLFGRAEASHQREQEQGDPRDGGQVPRLLVLGSQGTSDSSARGTRGHRTPEGACARAHPAQCRTQPRADVQAARNLPLGWKAYFRLAETPGALADIDGWIRHRLRAVQLKHWKRGRVIYRELVARGMPADAARKVAGNSRRWWHNSAMALNMALPNTFFNQLGVPPLAS